MNRVYAVAVIAVIASIATGAAGFVFSAVVGAAGFGVLSSAARDSERTKLASTEAKLKGNGYHHRRFDSISDELNPLPG